MGGILDIEVVKFQQFLTVEILPWVVVNLP